MNLKEDKQVAAIHQLPMAALGGMDSHGRMVDQGTYQSLDDLTRQLMNKNMKPLQFVCHDLQCQPEPQPMIRLPQPHHTRFNKCDWIKVLHDWVSSDSVCI